MSGVMSEIMDPRLVLGSRWTDKPTLIPTLQSSTMDSLPSAGRKCLTMQDPSAQTDVSSMMAFGC